MNQLLSYSSVTNLRYFFFIFLFFIYLQSLHCWPLMKNTLQNNKYTPKNHACSSVFFSELFSTTKGSFFLLLHNCVGGNRTRVNCLKDNYAHHYRTNALLEFLHFKKKLQSEALEEESLLSMVLSTAL